MTAKDILSRLGGESAEFVDEIYARFRTDPGSVDAAWREVFASLEAPPGGETDATAPAAATAKTAAAPAPTPADTTGPLQTFGLVNAYREYGHLIANVNPLRDPATTFPLLELARFGLSRAEIDLPCVAGGFRGTPPTTLRDLVEALRRTYCGTLGVELASIRDSSRRRWLEQEMEQHQGTPPVDPATRRRILTKLTEAEGFEQFLHVKYPGQKRFSLEGGESLIPMLDALLEKAADTGSEQAVLGMAHRGRLNVLANVVRKPVEMILAEFEGSQLPDWIHGDGDVKYHQGYSRDHVARSGKRIHVSLTPNPSHLELVNPVVEGKVRAKQNQIGDVGRNRVLPILVHGDAAFAGQGIVAETLLLTHLPGYYTGGTIHIVIDNQIGFTTPPESGRPTRYATDIARIIEAPVFHVNGDDPEACVHAILLALEFRRRFQSDAIVELVCFRKYGHNEADEPSFTQPTMYQRIAQHPGTRALYVERLLKEGAIDAEQVEAIGKEIHEGFDLALGYAREFRPRQQVFTYGDSWAGLGPAAGDRSARTAVSRDVLVRIAERALEAPAGFEVHPKIKKQYEARLEMVRRGKGIDWGCAEMLAFGSLVLEGTPVRLSGQDAGRGTFSHRHSVVHDQRHGSTWVPLNGLARPGEPQAIFEVVDSPLSEAAVLGFEYGFSSSAPHTLTIWEAQFGDFANGAQAIIDTFIAAAESKWQRSSGLVLLLPHGYEGQGPEHSSARLERYLQLCADDNLQVVNLTTSAQIFHALRRQVRRGFRKPLVVMSPKSLLRFGPVGCAIEDFTNAGFQPVLGDPVSLDRAQVETIALCSGKVFYDLARARQDRSDLRVAAVRVEELYPFPETEIREQLARYPGARDVVWVQEEPSNMGAWSYVEPRLRALLGDRRRLRYAGRDEAASPATGSYKQHAKDQEALLASVFPSAAPSGAKSAADDAA